MDVPPRQTVILMESLEQTQPRGASPATGDPALTCRFCRPLCPLAKAILRHHLSLLAPSRLDEGSGAL